MAYEAEDLTAGGEFPSGASFTDLPFDMRRWTLQLAQAFGIPSDLEIQNAHCLKMTFPGGVTVTVEEKRG